MSTFLAHAITVFVNDMSAVSAVLPMCPGCHPDWGKLAGHTGRCVRLSAEERKQRDNKVCESVFGALFSLECLFVLFARCVGAFVVVCAVRARLMFCV